MPSTHVYIGRNVKSLLRNSLRKLLSPLYACCRVLTPLTLVYQATDVIHIGTIRASIGTHFCSKTCAIVTVFSRTLGIRDAKLRIPSPFHFFGFMLQR